MKEDLHSVDLTLDSFKNIWLEKRDARFLPAAVEAMIDEGNKEEALGLCMEGIQLGEMSSTLGVLAGGLLISLGRGKEAAGVLRDVISGDPGNAEAIRLLRVVGSGKSAPRTEPSHIREAAPQDERGETNPVTAGPDPEKRSPDSMNLKRIREIVGSFD